MGKNIDEMTDSELRAELEKRKTERERAIHDRMNKLAKMLTKEQIDLLVPKHERTSCDDAGMQNGFRDEGLPRCNRCALLEMHMTESFPEGFAMGVHFFVYGGED